MSQAPERSAPSQEKTGGCFIRLTWMVFGTLAVLFSAVALSNNHGQTLSVADVTLWGAIALMLAARYYDISRLEGQTVFGEPATMATWRRYAGILVVVGLVVWGVARWMAWRGA